MKAYLEKNKRDLLCFTVLFSALLLRISWFGPEYYLQLDDYIHYRAYPAGTDFVKLCIENGLFTSRPLAALMDLVFWAKIPLYFSSVLLCAMYAAAGILYLRIFRRYFGTSLFFLVVFTLLPLGFEGTYWHAAATRILPPMLFSALALTAFDRFLETKRLYQLPLFLGWSLLSFCFYEQMLVLSLALSLMLMLVGLLQRKWHSVWGLSVFIPVAAYVGITGYFSGLADGQLSSRMQIVLPTDPTYFTDHLPRLTKQLQECFLDGGWLTLFRGFRRGLELIVSEGIWAAVLIAALAALIYLGVRKSPWEPAKLFHLAPIFGFLAALAPITPFLIIAKPWVCLRSTVPSFLGLALLADYLLRLILKNRVAAVTAVFASVCMVASVSELYDYRSVTQNNTRVAQAILNADEELELRGKVGILGLNQQYTQEQNYLYHDHVLSAHASDWALTGLLQYYAAGDEISFVPTPLAVDQEHYWYSWNKTSRDVTAYDTLLLYDHPAGSLVHLNVEKTDGAQWLLHDDTGVLRARVWEDDQGYGNIEFYPS